MKKILSGVLALVLAGSAFALDSENFIPEGTVTSYTKTEYAVSTKFGDYFRSVAAKHVHVFANGLKKEVSSYNGKDELTDKLVYQYNTSRQLVSLTYTDANNKTIWQDVYEYMADGRNKSSSQFDADGNLSSKTIYKYDGNKTIESFYDGTGKLLSRTIYTLNANNQKENEKQYFGDGSIALVINYTYDENNKLKQAKYIDENGTVETQRCYKYDNKGYISEIQIYDSNNVLIERDIYKNDSNGNPKKISIYEIGEKFGTSSNELKSVSEYSYKTTASAIPVSPAPAVNDGK